MDWTHVAVILGGMVLAKVLDKAPAILHSFADWLKGHNHVAAGDLLQELLDDHPNLKAELADEAKSRGLDKNPVIAAALAPKKVAT